MAENFNWGNSKYYLIKAINPIKISKENDIFTRNVGTHVIHTV